MAFCLTFYVYGCRLPLPYGAFTELPQTDRLAPTLLGRCTNEEDTVGYIRGQPQCKV
jgi:hypothetical protein